MRERYIWNLDLLSLKCANYWQSVLRFGLPVVILYRGSDYALFRMTARAVGVPYPWRVAAVTDIPLVFLMSTLWWWVIREIVSLKRKNQQREQSELSSTTENR
jgi:hypothetical protein